MHIHFIYLDQINIVANEEVVEHLVKKSEISCCSVKNPKNLKKHIVKLLMSKKKIIIPHLLKDVF